MASLVTQTVKNLPAIQETRVWSLGRKDPLEKGMATPLQYSHLENPMNRVAWVWHNLVSKHVHKVQKNITG